MMNYIALLLFLLIGHQKASAQEACAPYCMRLLCGDISVTTLFGETFLIEDPNCSDCDFCEEPETLCDSYCSLNQCGFNPLCQECEFCRFSNEGQRCDTECLFEAFTDPDLCTTSSERCGACPYCQYLRNIDQACDSWCFPGLCGFRSFCEGCDFCQDDPENPIPDDPYPDDCQSWCMDFTCDPDNLQCAGCPFCQDPPRRCDSWCMVKTCGSAECEDCDFCTDEPPYAEPQCDSFCLPWSCEFGNPELRQPCDGCSFCEAPSPPHQNGSTHRPTRYRNTHRPTLFPKSRLKKDKSDKKYKGDTSYYGSKGSKSKGSKSKGDKKSKKESSSAIPPWDNFPGRDCPPDLEEFRNPDLSFDIEAYTVALNACYFGPTRSPTRAPAIPVTPPPTDANGDDICNPSNLGTPPQNCNLVNLILDPQQRQAACDGLNCLPNTGCCGEYDECNPSSIEGGPVNCTFVNNIPEEFRPGACNALHCLPDTGCCESSVDACNPSNLRTPPHNCNLVIGMDPQLRQATCDELNCLPNTGCCIGTSIAFDNPDTFDEDVGMLNNDDNDCNPDGLDTPPRDCSWVLNFPKRDRQMYCDLSHCLPNTGCCYNDDGCNPPGYDTPPQDCSWVLDYSTRDRQLFCEWSHCLPNTGCCGNPVESPPARCNPSNLNTPPHDCYFVNSYPNKEQICQQLNCNPNTGCCTSW